MIFEVDTKPYIETGERTITLEYMQDIVGGYIEILSSDQILDDGQLVCMVINEEGKLIGLPTNVPATILAREYFGLPEDDYICGMALLIGGDEDGECFRFSVEEQEKLAVIFDPLLDNIVW